ncbi:MAG: hypothetical protein RJA36_3159 [Pseudomonadota bacterium]|jgi:uncharacterized protein YgbK (DUF1537 family)
MKHLRILADDLTGALDCAAAFGAGVPVHLGQPAGVDPEGIDIVATATRDVPPADLPALLAPSLSWLRGAELAFKKVDSLLRGNTFDEIDWLARQGGFAGLALVPAFPAQGRVTEDAQQWWCKAGGERVPVASPLRQALQALGWRVDSGATPPPPDGTPVAWVPDVRSDDEMDAIAAWATQCRPGWLWCGSAGLAHALARTRSVPVPTPSAQPQPSAGQVMLISASHHAVSREQWQLLRDSPWGSACHRGDDPRSLEVDQGGYPRLIDLSAPQRLEPAEAAGLLERQTQAIARHAPRPRTLVVVGGDTLLALCRALGATGLQSWVPLERAGWGCARLVGGRWDGLVCHTRSGAFGGPRDLVEVLDSV